MTDPSEQTSAEAQPIPRPRPHRALLTGFPVVLDACVLANATIRDFILWAADHALFRPLWSADILVEVRHTLEKFGVPSNRIDYMIGKMTSSFPEAEVIGYSAIVGSMTNDAKDRHVLAAAVIGKAQLIVTDNTRHFPEDALKPYQIEAIGSDDFLRDLLDLDRELMLDVLTTLAATRKMPPKTIDELLEALVNNGCSDFAEDLRKALGEEYGDS